MPILHSKSTIVKLAELPALLGLEFLLVILSIILLFIPSQWVHKKIKELREKRKRMRNLDQTVIEKIDNIDCNVTKISDKLDEVSSRHITAIKLSKTPTFITDADGKCVHANKALCNLFGSSEEEMLGAGWVTYIIDEDRSKAATEWKIALESDADVTNHYRIKHGITGRIIELEYRAVISRRSDKSIMYTMGHVYEVKS